MRSDGATAGGDDAGSDLARGRLRSSLARQVRLQFHMFGPKRRDAAFFDGLTSQAGLNVRAARMLQTMFARMTRASSRAADPYRTADGDARSAHGDVLVALASDIKSVERDGDRLKHDAMKRVRAN